VFFSLMDLNMSFSLFWDKLRKFFLHLCSLFLIFYQEILVSLCSFSCYFPSLKILHFLNYYKFRQL
jgi:hypothetical protein